VVQTQIGKCPYLSTYRWLSSYRWNVRSTCRYWRFRCSCADDKVSCVGDPPELTVTTVERGTSVVSTAGKRSTAWFGWMTMLQRVRECGGFSYVLSERL
jgi:hypothetical protein